MEMGLPIWSKTEKWAWHVPNLPNFSTKDCGAIEQLGWFSANIVYECSELQEKTQISMLLKVWDQNSTLQSLRLLHVWAPHLLLVKCSFWVSSDSHPFSWLCEPIKSEMSCGKPDRSLLYFLLLRKKSWKGQTVPSTSVKADMSHGWNWTLPLILLVYIQCKTCVSQMDSIRAAKSWEAVIDGKFQETQLTSMRKSSNVKTLGELTAILNVMMRWIMGI